jgi:hypothetical protein
MASLLLIQAAYAATPPPYPGYPGQPGIPPGPTLGCNNAGTDATTWVCGFNAQSAVTFQVNGHYAGSGTADANGCVLVIVQFFHGHVQVNGNAPIRVRPGVNYLIVEGHKTTGGTTQVVGLRLPFATPPPGRTSCPKTKPTPPTSIVTVPTSGPPTSIGPRPTVTTFPVLTTIHGFYPTTLAKVIETPLMISPNKVIVESGLLSGVLAAVLSAGALGVIWSAGEGTEAGASAAGAAAGGAAAGGAAGASGGQPPPTPPPPMPPPPTPPAAGPTGAAPGGTPPPPSAEASGPSAFQRTYPEAPGGGA